VTSHPTRSDPYDSDPLLCPSIVLPTVLYVGVKGWGSAGQVRYLLISDDYMTVMIICNYYAYATMILLWLAVTDYDDDSIITFSFLVGLCILSLLVWIYSCHSVRMSC